jgi:hypothetical protein
MVRPTSAHSLLTGVVVPERYMGMINRFGDYFQKLWLVVHGEVSHLHQSCREVLIRLARCQLESIVLKIGEGTVPRNRLPADVVGLLMAFLKEAPRLRYIDIRAWPIHIDDDKSDGTLLDVMCGNKNIRYLEKLKLFWWDAAEDSWVPLVTCLPPPDAVVKTLAHFSALTSLCLRSPMLTSAVLEELSKPRRSTLHRLGVLAMYNQGPTGFDTKFPCIPERVWKDFTETNPGVGVDFTFSNTVPTTELMSLFNSEIPLSSVSFMKYSTYQPDILAHLAANYHRTLTSFVDYGDSSFEKELINLVTRCHLLKVFICHSCLSCVAVLTLAKTRQRGCWCHFDVAVNLISNEVTDENMVLLPVSDGYTIVAHQPGTLFYHTDESKQQEAVAVATLSEEVSNIIGFKWKPLYCRP